MRTETNKRITERIRTICYSESDSIRDFAQKIHIKYNTLNQQLRTERSISLDVIVAINERFPKYSPNFMILGNEGERAFCDNHIDGNISSKIQIGNSIENSELLKKYEEKIEEMRQTIAQKDDIIAKLVNKL